MPTLRLVSADARHFGRDRAGLAAALGAATPDVAIVHHAPHLGRWRSLSASIARGAGLVGVGGGRTGGANLLLSTLAIDFVSVSEVLFTHNPARPAGVAVARLRRHGVEFALAGASLGAQSRQTDAAALRLALSDVGDLPLVLSVDGGAADFADLGEVRDRFVTSPRVTMSGGVERAGEGLLVATVALS